MGCCIRNFFFFPSLSESAIIASFGTNVRALDPWIKKKKKLLFWLTRYTHTHTQTYTLDKINDQLATAATHTCGCTFDTRKSSSLCLPQGSIHYITLQTQSFSCSRCLSVYCGSCPPSPLKNTHPPSKLFLFALINWKFEERLFFLLNDGCVSLKREEQVKKKIKFVFPGSKTKKAGHWLRRKEKKKKSGENSNNNRNACVYLWVYIIKGVIKEPRKRKERKKKRMECLEVSSTPASTHTPSGCLRRTWGFCCSQTFLTHTHTQTPIAAWLCRLTELTFKAICNSLFFLCAFLSFAWHTPLYVMR